MIGDRRILRFLRGKQNNVDEASKQYAGFLKWRKMNNIDKIRHDILYNGMNSPFLFPHGKKIIDFVPQIVITANANDKMGRPMSLEMYNFSPSKLFQEVKMDEYLLFLTYCLEYRALVMEQLSHNIENQYLSTSKEISDGYGVVVMNCFIRDLKGVGMAHLGGEGRSLIKAAVNLGTSNFFY